MSDLELLSAAMSAVLGTKVQARTILESQKETLFIRADDFFHQTYPIMTPAVEAVPLETGKMFDLIVTRLQNEKKAIRVSGRRTIAEVRAAIAKNEGRPVDKIKRTYEGKQLEECQSLNDYGITSAATISWVPCLPKGGPSLSYFFDPNEFDFNYDFDFSQMKDDGKTYMRGGFEYKRPYGWKRFGLKVRGKYENDIWLGPDGIRTEEAPGEWPVSYHGTNVSNARKIVETGFKPGPRAKYGKGIYTSPSLEMVERFHAQEFTHKGKTYKIVLQNRVNPDRLKVIRASETLAGADYWLFPERDKPGKVDVRPYGVLIRETGHVQEQDESEQEPIRDSWYVQEQDESEEEPIRDSWYVQEQDESEEEPTREPWYVQEQDESEEEPIREPWYVQEQDESEEEPTREPWYVQEQDESEQEPIHEPWYVQEQDESEQEPIHEPWYVQEQDESEEEPIREPWYVQEQDESEEEPIREPGHVQEQDESEEEPIREPWYVQEQDESEEEPIREPWHVQEQDESEEEPIREPWYVQEQDNQRKSLSVNHGMFRNKMNQRKSLSVNQGMFRKKMNQRKSLSVKKGMFKNKDVGALYSSKRAMIKQFNFFFP